MRSVKCSLPGVCFAVLLVLCSASQLAYAQETKTFVAYSMKAAQARVEEAVKAGEDFRKKQPDLYYLGGITKPWAVVLDTEGGDWILVGERDPKSSILTLDDWVVALRARFIHPETDPGVTIDPRPCEECLNAGKKESCRHYTKQDVRFFAGIENTHFGQVCYEADWLMKRIGLGLERLPIDKLKTYYDLSLEQHRNAGATTSSVGSRFWFYPIVNRVNVVGDVVLLEKFQMGVFTEVLHAEVDRQPVADVDKFQHYPSEGFSRSFSDNYNAAAQAREMLETLRGLTRLAALAKGLTATDARPSVDFYLTGYPLVESKTLREADVLTVENREVGFEVSGGVRLMALAMRLKGGDVRALKELVLGSRLVVNALTWGFVAKMRAGYFAAVAMPEELAASRHIFPLVQQADFLYEKKYYDAAIECCTKALELDPHFLEAHRYRAFAYLRKSECDLAIADLNQLLHINPSDANGYCARGVAYAKKRQYDQAISDYTMAIGLSPTYVDAYNNRGNAYTDIGRYERAISDFNKAVQLNPKDPVSYTNRGAAYAEQGQHDQAVSDYSTAIGINAMYADAYYNRGIAYTEMAQYDRAITDFSAALAINPRHDGSYTNRGRALMANNHVTQAFADFNKALECNPTSAMAYNNRGRIHYYRGNYDLAIADLKRAAELEPTHVLAHYNLGDAYYYNGNWRGARAHWERVIELAPDDPHALDARESLDTMRKQGHW